MPNSDDNHLMSVTPLPARYANRVMNWRILLWHNFLFVGFQTAWLWGGGLLIFIASHLPDGQAQGRWLYIFGVCFALAWLAGQAVLVFVYPEWPMNVSLCNRLRSAVASRSDAAPTWTTNQDVRVVEMVPRDRWNKVCLDTAADLLLLNITDDGIAMEGDRARYWLPAESILDVKLESIRPGGWFTKTHMVVIYARGGEGIEEITISYRDHALGELSYRARHQAAAELVQAAMSISNGRFYDAPIVPDHHLDRASSYRSQSINPYQAPATLD